MKIYTKTGDKGTTALVGGTRVAKDNPRVEAYGTVDELISWIGVVRTYPHPESESRLFRRIQECLMTCAALLAADDATQKKLPVITVDDINELEQAIDRIQNDLPPLKAFLLPANPRPAAFCHVARCVCRRAERQAVTVLNTTGGHDVLNYLNRLSDYLFILSRLLTVNSNTVEDYWLP